MACKIAFGNRSCLQSLKFRKSCLSSISKLFHAYDVIARSAYNAIDMFKLCLPYLKPSPAPLLLFVHEYTRFLLTTMLAKDCLPSLRCTINPKPGNPALTPHSMQQPATHLLVLDRQPSEQLRPVGPVKDAEGMLQQEHIHQVQVPCLCHQTMAGFVQLCIHGRA